MRQHRLGPQFSGIFDFLFGYTPADDPANGLQLLTAYHNEALNYPQNYTYATVADLDAAITAVQGPTDWATQLGTSYRNAEDVLTLGAATSAMTALADSTQGTATASQMTLAVTGVGTGSINYEMEIPTVGVETTEQVAEDVGTAAQEVGQAVITAGQGVLNIVEWLPYILVGVGVLAVYVFMTAEGKEAGAVKGAVGGIL